MKRILYSFALLWIFSADATAQIDSAYYVYKSQFSDLMKSRGFSEFEVKKILEDYSQNNISSSQSFASVLTKLYPTGQSTAVLLYLFNKDTLIRTLLEPGKVVEEARIAISKDSIIGLGKDLNLALNLDRLSEKRSPIVRGVRRTENDSMNRPDLQALVSKITSLLIPKSFDTGFKHLIVIPSVNIGTIPFQLLQPYNDGSFLIDRCSITIAPNLIDFVALRVRLLKTIVPSSTNYALNFESHFPEGLPNNWTTENALFICNPRYPQSDEYVFPDLPGTELEVDSAKKFCSRFVLLHGDSATKQNVLKHLGNSDLAYFATHGVADSAQPLLGNYLVLSGTDPFLTSKEINMLRMKENYKAPQMVILSACQTGLGKSMEAGTMGSIARSFLISGSFFVFESLWSVDDEATAFLMGRFMYYIQTPCTYFPSEPLQKAIIDTRQKYPSPIHWASFSLIGTDL